MEEETVEQIAGHYIAMGHSVNVINGVINNSDTYHAALSDEGKRDAVDRNVGHLELMLTRDYWTDEDMSSVNSAITAGKAYNG
tara:strand:+ start:58 stop:306 length:249 start_codon:yes stop_codon:yes gene_type:complete